MAPRIVSFTTSDGVTIIGEEHGDGGAPGALLLHMMPATKESWRPFADALVRTGFGTVLAIDLRGHGESVRGADGAALDHREFTDAAHGAKRLDVEAAMAWLSRERGVDAARCAIVGASIGANLALVHAAGHPAIRAIVALSPGLDYRGVTTQDAVEALAPDQEALLAASDEDTYSFETVRSLARSRPSATLRELRGAGHGTTMFERAPAFMAATVAWLRERMLR